MAKFDATMTMDDRTGTGDDCHYKVEFEGNKKKSNAFLNAMIFGAQEVSMTLDKPIDFDNESTVPEIIALQNTKKNFWTMGVQVEEEQVIPRLNKLIKKVKDRKDQGPSDHLEP